MSSHRPIRPADLGITRLLWAFAVLSIALTALLALVPARASSREWHSIQARYNALAARRHAKRVPVGIQQIWRPGLQVVDRCTTCHLGMGTAEPLAKRELFAAHPAIPHEPREFGCTVCHSGQGRATTAAAAHGRAPHWDEPLLERGTYEAGCGTCHSHIRVPSATLAARGRALFEQSQCGACHAASSGHSPVGPDLSTVGLSGHRADWHADHVRRSGEARETDPWATRFAPLADEEALAIDEYLGTLVGAPRLMEGKILAHESGCRGCHRIGGVGGLDAPDLSNEGMRSASDLDFQGVRGRHTLRSWLREHFLDPARVVPGSQMPDLGFSAEQADSLTTYMLSLRDKPIPEAFAPRDRVRVARLQEREFHTDGASLYGVFCAARHGPRGEGKRFGTPAVTFPAIGNADFLAIADSAFLRRTLVDGRPGRRMPAWGANQGGLRPAEIDALVEHLQDLAPPAASFDEVMAAPVDVERGARLFARDCSTCHGESGAGTVLAPPLAAADNPVTQSDNALYGTLATGVAGTAMGPFRRYDAASVRAVIAAVRALPPSAATRSAWRAAPGDRRRGAGLFGRVCRECHGSRGEGVTAPALANPALLAAAGDGYLAATIVRGRAGTAMPSFGSPPETRPKLDAQQVADVVAFLRSLAPRSSSPEEQR